MLRRRTRIRRGQLLTQDVQQRLQKDDDHRTDQNPDRAECLHAAQDAQQGQQRVRLDRPCNTHGLMKLSAVETIAAP